MIREAVCRCCATLSATSLSAETRSSVPGRVVMKLRGGISSSPSALPLEVERSLLLFEGSAGELLERDMAAGRAAEARWLIESGGTIPYPHDTTNGPVRGDDGGPVKRVEGNSVFFL